MLELPLRLSGLRTQIVSLKMQVRSLALLRGLRILGFRKLRCRSAAAALIQSLAWELPYAAGTALRQQIFLEIKIHIDRSLLEQESHLRSPERASQLLQVTQQVRDGPWCPESRVPPGDVMCWADLFFKDSE